jgi:homoserine O-acetyltransferase
MDLFDLGDFPLSTGVTLPAAKLAYKTHGSLNKAKDNAILFPNILGGAPEVLEIWIGEGRPLDPNKYFIILPAHFGLPPTSAPSNTPPPFDRGGFPAVHIADDVIAQHRLVTEKFGIEELQLILGWSVGGLQLYEWAVRFSHMVRRIAPIATAPKPSPWTRLWLQAIIEEPITSDPAWNNGFYADAKAVQGGLRRVGHGAALTLPPPGFYREGQEVWRSAGFASQEDFVRRMWESYWINQDPNDIVTQARKTGAADPSQGGDIATALGKIEARTFVASFTGDQMFQPEAGRWDADHIPNAQFREIPSSSGHLATFAFSAQDAKAVDGVLSELLAD